MRRAIFGAALIALVTIPALPTQAHTDTEIDVWIDAWTADVRRHGLTLDRLTAYLDFVDRHRCQILGQDCPRREVRDQAPTHQAPSANRGMGSNVEQWRGLVAAYFAPGQVETALRVMRCESGGNPNARNSRSGAAGLFQHLPKYWAERSAKAGWGGASIYSPEANVAVSAWLVRNGGWGHWTCY